MPQIQSRLNLMQPAGSEAGASSRKVPLGVLIMMGAICPPIMHKSYLNAMSFNSNKIHQQTGEIKIIAFWLKTENQNKNNRFLRLTNGHAVPAKGAAILDGSCDKEEDEERSHDLVTKEQYNLE